MDWVFESVKTWTSEKNLDAPDMILITILTRSARTYEANVRWLGERAFGEQGLMLNRSLFEDMIDAHWVSINRDLAVERLQQHDLYSRLLRADTQRRFPRFFDGELPPKIKVSNDERKNLQRLFGKSGTGSWTGIKGLDNRVEMVKDCWKTPEDQEALLFWTAWVNKLSNEILHPSAFSIARLGSPKVEDGQIGWHFGSTRKWLPQSLHGAFWTFSQLVGLMVDSFDSASAEEFGERLKADRAAFRRASHWESTGRLEDPPSG